MPPFSRYRGKNSNSKLKKTFWLKCWLCECIGSDVVSGWLHFTITGFHFHFQNLRNRNNIFVPELSQRGQRDAASGEPRCSSLLEQQEEEMYRYFMQEQEQLERRHRQERVSREQRQRQELKEEERRHLQEREELEKRHRQERES